jgi:hypothetical protein
MFLHPFLLQVSYSKVCNGWWYVLILLSAVCAENWQPRSEHLLGKTSVRKQKEGTEEARAGAPNGDGRRQRVGIP